MTDATTETTEETTVETTDDLFAEPTKEPTEVTTETVKSEVVTEELETNKGVTTDPPTESKEVVGLKAALVAERRKRQEAEEQLRAKEVIPDPTEDAEGYASHVAQKYQRKWLNDSREDMLETTPDYLEKETVFMGLIINADGKIVDPLLHEKFLTAKNPARFAYKHAVDHLKVESLKNLDLEKIKKEAFAAGLQAAKKKGVAATEVPDLISITASESNNVDTPRERTLSELFED